MSADTPIEWTVTIGPDGARHKGMTFNPWWGCAKVSPACKNCYAERLAARFNRGEWTPNGDRAAASEATWAEPLAWNRKATKLGVRLKVFCASMADVFEYRADLDPLRERLWALITTTPHLDWLLLTKRPDVMARWAQTHAWPVNAWAGTTVEDQRRADERIPALLRVPARVRFLSCEPLRGALDLDLSGIHWVIAGGESGPGARPSHPDWFRSLRDQCAAAGVPFHFKQWGAWCSRSQRQTDNQPASPPNKWGVLTIDGEFFPYETTLCGEMMSVAREAEVRCIGKHAAGRLLDGVEHNDYPTAKEPNP